MLGLDRRERPQQHGRVAQHVKRRLSGPLCRAGGGLRRREAVGQRQDERPQRRVGNPLQPFRAGPEVVERQKILDRDVFAREPEADVGPQREIRNRDQAGEARTLLDVLDRRSVVLARHVGADGGPLLEGGGVEAPGQVGGVAHDFEGRVGRLSAEPKRRAQRGRDGRRLDVLEERGALAEVFDRGRRRARGDHAPQLDPTDKRVRGEPPLDVGDHVVENRRGLRRDHVDPRAQGLAVGVFE